MTEPARQSKIHLNDDGSRKFKSSSLQQRGIANREIVARQQRSQLSGAGGSFPNVVPDMLPYFVNYRDDYSATITITNLTKAGDMADTMVLNQAFPTNISDLTWSWSNCDNFK